MHDSWATMIYIFLIIAGVVGWGVIELILWLLF